MPFGDGTGPLSQGLGNYQGRGPCGFDLRHRWFGYCHRQRPWTKEEELVALEEEGKALNEELEAVNKRAEELKGQK